MSAGEPSDPRRRWLVLRATPEQVMVGVEALQALCAATAVPDDVTHRLMLALEETGANIVNHAYAGDAGRSFRVRLERRDDDISVEVRDDGPPFDPFAPRPAPADVDPDDPPIGGLGLGFIRGAADEVVYAREGGENVLRLRQRLG